MPSLAAAACRVPRQDDLSGRMLRGRPRLSLANLPTPIEPLTMLADGAVARSEDPHGRGGPRPALWVKRDDRSSELYGGSKVRKLEWLLAEQAFRQGPLLSVGATGSHHLLALALFAALREQPLHALVCPQPRSEHATRNFAALLSVGTRVIPMRSRLSLPWALARERVAERLGGRTPAAWVPAGASDDAALLGFVVAALELHDQITRGEAPAFDRIYITGGTLGASTGLILGLALAGRRAQVHVVSAVERIACNPLVLGRKLEAGARYLAALGLTQLRGGAARLLERVGIALRVDGSQVGRGYAASTPEALHAVMLAEQVGLELETTYTGKCLSAMLRDAAREAPPVDEHWLFWNTHGGAARPGWIVDGWRERVPSMLLRGIGSSAD